MVQVSSTCSQGVGVWCGCGCGCGGSVAQTVVLVIFQLVFLLMQSRIIERPSNLLLSPGFPGFCKQLY
jgi:hypothetical protein